MKLSKLVEQIHGQVYDDHEMEMAISDLRAMANKALALADHYEKENLNELEGWVQAKITKAADYIGSVYDSHMFSPNQNCESCGDGINEVASTCCGRCGRKHVKGTSCPKPFLTGKRHCRNRD